jgi:hypothetical protein
MSDHTPRADHERLIHLRLAVNGSDMKTMLLCP